MGLGDNLKLINDAIDILGHTPQGWNNTNLFLLMGAAESFEKNHIRSKQSSSSHSSNSNSTPKVEQPSSQHNVVDENAIVLKVQQALQKQELRQSQLQKEAIALIESNKMTKEIELGPKFAQKFPQGCYFCGKVSHGYLP